MKVKAGKYYKTRGGAKVFAVGHEPFSGTIVVVYPTGKCFTVLESGTDCSERSGTEFDLVEEWREPVSKEVTVYLLNNHEVGVCQKRQFLSTPACSIIARKTVTITEGEGMETP